MRIVSPKELSRRVRRDSKAAKVELRSSRAPISNLKVEFRRPGAARHGCDVLLDDAAWIHRIQRGDEQAARDMVERLRPTILKCIRSRLPRWLDEEDLIQNVLAKVFSHWHQFSGSVPLEHWVSRIAINTSLNQIDHEAVRPELRLGDLTEEQESVLQNRAAAVDTAPARNDAREVLEVLLAQLKPDERLIITLLHIEERSTHEISQMTGLSISLVKVKAFRTRHKMRRLGTRLLRSEKH